jgi:hypothetical protein
MPHRRHTITVGTSALFFVCLMLHAQRSLYSQTPTPYNDAEAYKIYESLLPADWTLTVARARRLIQAQTGSSDFTSREDLQNCFKPVGEGWKILAEQYPDSAHSYIVLSPVTLNWNKTVSAVDMGGHSCDGLCGGYAFQVVEKKDGIWKNLRWRGTSCAWAS